jgi:ribosomal protein S18 acetylase RimI-like enzyme
MPIIRRYEPRDRAAVYDICIRTAHLGGDAREVYQDPDVLPEIFAGPYLEFDPDLAFIAADGDAPVGYILATADTPGFVDRFRRDWLPRVSARYPPGSAKPETPDEFMVHLLHTPERMIVPEVAGYPAHLHIDLLPGYQRAGHGRALMDTLTGELGRRGVPALHLCMVNDNRAARAFYDRIGFHVIDVPDPGPVTYLGLAV